MAKELRYPIGEQNFPSIREEGKVYVDKTGLIYDLVRNYKYVFLSRPRRFGKSLLLSTLEAYFEGRRELFEGLALHDLEKDWKRHPVLHLSFASFDASDPGSLASILEYQISEWEEKYDCKDDGLRLAQRFKKIIKNAVEKTGEKAVVLIDEYDHPLINTLDNNPHHEEHRNLLKSIYSNLKDMDGYLKFGMLTGVSRFSRTSVFSGINNLRDISFDEEYEAICGITENELKTILWPGIEIFGKDNEMSTEEVLSELKKHYDGYHFSTDLLDIYNPFSLLTALANRKIGSYWFTSGTPTFLIRWMLQENVDIQEFLNSSANEQSLASTDTDHRELLPLLFQTGYLTIKNYDPMFKEYILGIPNLEVREGLFHQLMMVYQSENKEKNKKLIRQLIGALLDGDAEAFMQTLQSFLAGISNRLTEHAKEIYFENNLFIIFGMLGIYVNVEEETSDGRMDMVVKTDGYVYIMEFKLDSTPEEAMRQIEEKNYPLKYNNDGRRIIKIGVNFSSETRNITGWVITG